MNVKTVLAALDGSIFAEAALAPAVDLAREAQDYLAAARARVTAAGVRNVEVSAWYGPPAEAIVVARLVLGSVAERVLRATAVPILLIRPDGARVDAPFMAAPSAEKIAHV